MNPENPSEKKYPLEQSDKASIFRRKVSGWLKSVLVYGVLFLIISHAVDFYRFSKHESQQIEPVLLQLLKTQLPARQQQGFSEGEPMLVYVWASWCGVCKTTSRAASNISDDYPVATLALKSGNQAAVDSYLKKKSYAFSAIADEDGWYTQSLQTHATPSFFIINHSGRILYYSVGINTEPSLRTKLAYFSSAP